eukprot:1541309-Rhodomonas_salina.2
MCTPLPGAVDARGTRCASLAHAVHLSRAVHGSGALQRGGAGILGRAGTEQDHPGTTGREVSTKAYGVGDTVREYMAQYNRPPYGVGDA